METIKYKLISISKKAESIVDKYNALFHLLYFTTVFMFYYFPILNIYGYEYNNAMSIQSALISMVIGSVVIISFEKISGKNHFITLIATVVSFQVVYPELVYYAFNNSSLVVPLSSSLTVISLLVMSKYLSINEETSRDYPFLITATLTVLLCIPFLSYFPYINLKNLILQDIYVTRALFQSKASSLMIYLIAPLTRLLFPIVLAQALKRKNYKATVLFLVLYSYIYLCGAYRSIFLGLIATALFYFGSYLQKQRWYTVLMLLGVFVSILTFLPLVNIGTNLLRRLLFVPPGMNNIYVTEFLGNPTYFAHSGLTFGLLGNPFGNLPIYIGEQVIGIPGLSANVGLFVEGFVGFGYYGIIASVFMICGIVYLFNKISVPVEFFGIVYVFIYYFNNSLISTLLLTHGLFFALAFFVFAKSNYFKDRLRRKVKND